ncbi:hypothetical protein Y032_0288g1488 [Ancylostoma ceylanicum]|uniref:Integrase catalytic domain-containing protein n=1 Tax=Ancylostoma ceylanicum TaxID=53326 RepID=A0A016S5L9_9BILA|nr:hypothetical protein Y032_0288g1488 [Ancylostoma ceylanicum]
MLRKKAHATTEWDKILPACVFAYNNTTAHESTGESPFFILHRFDTHVPWDAAESEGSKYAVDIDSYVQELAIATQIARQYAQEVNKKMRNRMKSVYDHDKRVCVEPSKVGERVYMMIPSEKQSSRDPKLVNPWEGPSRVLETSDNSAIVTLIKLTKTKSL